MKFAKGNFTLPSYKYTSSLEKSGEIRVLFDEFSSSIPLSLFYETRCGLYYVNSTTLGYAYYKSETDALKALYVYRKYGRVMDGRVDCN
jgi:hypothetical protein